MQLYADIHYQNILHVSGVLCTHHQEYIKLQLQPLVQIILYGEQASSNVTK